MGPVGERVQHYRIVRLLGAGGMGEVYQALDERLRREVALKFLPQAEARVADRQARLLREAQAASHLNHPGIVTIHDVGRWRERNYIVMELVDGRRLGEVARAGVTPAEAVALVRQAAQALAAAHERGILHRDIKPDNMMVTRDGRLKILDFGLAKLHGAAGDTLDTDSIDLVDPEPIARPGSGSGSGSGSESESASGAESVALAKTIATPIPAPAPPDLGVQATLASPPTASSSLTRAGSLLGTPAYMSPEQARGEALDERSEVYALGLVLHELLTGARVLERETLDETLAAARDPSVPQVSTAAAERGRRVARRLRRPVDRVVARATAVDPERRYPTMRALASALDELAPRMTLHRVRTAAAAGALAAAVIGVGGTVMALRKSADGGGRGDAPAAARGGGGSGGGGGGKAAAAMRVDRVERLTFDRGCEEFPSFTPDGTAVVFDAVVGDDTEVMRLDLATGARAQLTHARGWDMGGAPSPDGAWVSYIHYGDTGRELMVMKWDGAVAGPARSVALVRGMPRWAPDGRLLYADDEGRIWAADVAADPPRVAPVATVNRGLLIPYLEGMADGSVLFAVGTASSEKTPLEIGAVRRGGEAHLFDPPLRVMLATGLTADASRSGFYYGAETGAGQRLLWRPLGDQPGEAVMLEGVPFPYGGMSSARDRLVLSTCRQVYSIARLGRDGRQVALSSAREWSDSSAAPMGGHRHVFASDRRGRVELWTLREGDEPALLMSTPSDQPSVSPDLTQLVWMSLEPSARGIAVAKLDGTGRRQLTDVDTDERPQFSRDGQTIYFLRGDAAGGHVMRVPFAGGPAVRVTPDDVADFAISPTDDRLVWLARGSTGRALLHGAPDTAGTPIAGLPPGNYTNPVFSTDGRSILVVRGGNELLEARLDGRRKPTVVWRTANDFIGRVAPDPDTDGWIAAIAIYEGDLHLAHGRFR
ncbi:MAG TPA: protein kinase [Kofleriaceae bacterium]|nr:protein kinase [Kofleriaceae bacterium]